MADNNQINPESQDGPMFNIQRIYVKDMSFEMPLAPEIFKEEWKPQVNVDFQTKSNRLEESIYEVVLHITVTVKMGERTAFLAEVHQAGIFTMKSFPAEHLAHALGSMCPSILYPFTREVISDIVIRGGFPQLLLAPVNFDALYAQHLAEQGKGDTTSTRQMRESSLHRFLVVGAGAWGTALAIYLARQNHSVVLWGHDPQHMEKLRHDHCNEHYLPQTPFPPSLIVATQDLPQALAVAGEDAIILMVVPSHAFKETADLLKPVIKSDTRIISATKGLSEEGELLSTFFPSHPFAVLSGPEFCKGSG